MSNNSNGRFVWFEYVSTDLEKAKGFFGELFGWTTQKVPMPQGDYAMIAVGDRTIGGYFVPPPEAPQHAHWLSHLLVADAKASAAQVKSLGGRIAKEATKIGDFGTMAIVVDEFGAAFALWQPAKAEDEQAPTTGTFCWNELASKDVDKSVAFYKTLGGFDHDQMDMGAAGAYHLLKSGGQPRAGLMQSTMGQPHSWLPYVQVANADATNDKAKKLGATQIVPPMDIPNVGRFAIFADPQGAPLGVLQPAK